MLAFFALLVIRLDPDVSPHDIERLTAIAAAFVVYSIVLALLAWRMPMAGRDMRVALHLVDFICFSAFIELTNAAVSPFFVFFLFSMLSALLRFGVKGMLATASAAILVYVAMSLMDENIRSDPGYLIMRTASFTIVAALLAYAGAYHERVRGELTKLAAWPRGSGEQFEPVVEETLGLARDLLSAPRAMLAWDDEEEPWTWLASLDRGGFAITRERPDLLDAMFVDGGTNELIVARNPGTHVLSQEAHERFRMRTFVSAPVKGQTMSGRIFFVDRDDFGLEDAAVAEISARIVATRLDQLNIATRMRATAVTDERLRVARDLHDGLLQSLTGASLQLEMVHHLIGNDPAAARQRLRSVQELIEADQRELRALITALRPDREGTRRTLRMRLLDLVERFERQWDVAVALSLHPDAGEMEDAFASEVYNIVTEGMANAAKHARATRVEVRIHVDGRDLAILIEDDGVGFPFSGTFTLHELDELRRGPVTLKERVASLGGDLVLQSTPAGSRIDIRVSRAAATLSA